MAWLRIAPWIASTLVLACGNGQVQDSGDLDGGPTTSAGTGPTTTASPTTTPDADTGSTSAPATSSTTAAEGTTTTDASTGPGEPVACGTALTCEPGQICVVPCCGGPAPGCEEQQPGDECLGTIDEGGAQCCQTHPDPVACMMSQWCIPGPCVPDPPYCVPAQTVTCNEFECTVEGGCFGMLGDDDVLHCRGCK